MTSTAFDKVFRDDQGNFILFQKPNLPVLTGLTATLLSLTPISGELRAGVEAVAYGALFTWAWLELFQGVNYFRRFLGLIVLLLVVATQL